MTTEQVEKFKNSIIYAPNGFGKTRTANEINNYYLKKTKEEPLFFTRKKIESLVSTFKNKIFFGTSSKFRVENAKIEDSLVESEGILDKVRSIYGFQKNSAFKNKSFISSEIFERSKISLDKLSDLFNKIEGQNYRYENCFAYDKILQKNTYRNCKRILSEPIKNYTKHKKKTILVDYEVLMSFKEIQQYIKDNKLNRCPVCGTEFNSYEVLSNKVKKVINQYYCEDENDEYEELLETTKIVEDELSNIKDLQDKKLEYPKSKKAASLYAYIFEYVRFCDQVKNDVAIQLSKLEFNGKQLKDLCKKRNDNNDLIVKEQSKTENKDLFNKTLLKEFKTIVMLPPKVKAELLKNEFGIQLLIDKKPINNLYEVLSESEIKRFVLSVFATLLEFSNSKVVILDDPIDSYDDYYVEYSCSFIMNFLTKEFKDKKIEWFIFTNSFYALQTFMSQYNCPDETRAYIGHENIQYFKDFNLYETDYFETDKNELIVLSNNEIQIMNSFINTNEYEVNKDIIFLGLLTTIRNFEDLILGKMDSINISKYEGPLAPRYSKNEFVNKVKKYIEASLLHCCKIPYEYKKIKYIESENIKVKDVALLFDTLSNKSEENRSLLSYLNSDETMIDFRKRVIDEFLNGEIKFNVINYVFFKIVYVAYLKFRFEEVIINKMSNYYKYDQKRIVKFEKAKGLNKKIQSLYITGDNKERKEFQEKCFAVHRRHCSMINSFEHGLARMIPPYLATSFKDILSLKNDIEKLKNSRRSK